MLLRHSSLTGRRVCVSLLCRMKSCQLSLNNITRIDRFSLEGFILWIGFTFEFIWGKYSTSSGYDILPKEPVSDTKMNTFSFKGKVKHLGKHILTPLMSVLSMRSWWFSWKTENKHPPPAAPKSQYLTTHISLV